MPDDSDVLQQFCWRVEFVLIVSTSSIRSIIRDVAPDKKSGTTGTAVDAVPTGRTDGLGWDPPDDSEITTRQSDTARRWMDEWWELSGVISKK